MTIAYLFDLYLCARKAHDIYLVKTCHSLAEAGLRIYLLAGRTEVPEQEIWSYYGRIPHPRLTLVQVPRLHRRSIPLPFLRKLRISYTGIFNYFCISALRRIYRREGLDLVVISGLKPALLYLRHQREFQVPYVYDVHQLYSKDSPVAETAALERKILQQARSLIVTTSALEKMLRTEYDLADKVIAKVPLATDLPRFDRFSGGGGVSERARICYVGQVYPMQGVDLLIESLRYLPQVSLQIVGGRGPRDLERLRARAGALGVGERVSFHGFIAPNQLAEFLLAHADILVIPTRSAGRMPYVAHTKVYEYLALGRPIVAARLPSVEEVLTDGKNAVLVEPDDPKKLAEGIQRILDDPELAHAVSRQAYVDAKQYSWQKRAELLSSVFSHT
ncbi:MAG: glycosyltransferase family 4 protein [Candidatus Methylomirabilia bacterium]